MPPNILQGFIGIDPGLTGAAALLVDDRIVDVVDFIQPRDVLDSLRSWTMVYPITLVALERVQALRRDNPSTLTKFLGNWGWWQGALDTLGLPYVQVRPQAWQAGVVPARRGSPDKPGLGVARELWPREADVWLRRKMDHNRADAMLIARWASRYSQKDDPHLGR